MKRITVSHLMTSQQINDEVNDAFQFDQQVEVTFKKGTYKIPFSDPPINLKPGMTISGNGAIIMRDDMPALPAEAILPQEMIDYLNLNYDHLRNSQFLRLVPHDERIQFIIDNKAVTFIHHDNGDNERVEVVRSPEFALAPHLLSRLETEDEFIEAVLFWLETVSAWRWRNEFNGAITLEKNTNAIIIRNLIFDGNQKNQWDFNLYQLQHAHLCNIAVNSSSPNKRRLELIVEKCTFRNGVGDGLSIGPNINGLIDQCKGHNVFRGDITIVGGNSDLTISNFRGNYIQVEIDGGGFEGNMDGELTFRNSEVSTFHVTAHADYHVRIEDSTVFKNFVMDARHGSFVVVNSSITTNGNINENYIFTAAPGVFDNCKFYLDDVRQIAPQRINEWTGFNSDTGFNSLDPHKAVVYIRNSGDGKSISFTDCNFFSNRRDYYELFNSLGGVAAIALEPMTIDTQVKLLRSDIQGFFRAGILTRQGGHIQVHQCSINAETAFWLADTRTNVVDLILADVNVLGSENYALFRVGVEGSEILHLNVQLHLPSSNIIIIDPSGRRLTDVRFSGHRTILASDIELTSLSPQPCGFKGDLLKVTAGNEIQIWECIETTHLGQQFVGTWELRSGEVG